MPLVLGEGVGKESAATAVTGRERLRVHLGVKGRIIVLLYGRVGALPHDHLIEALLLWLWLLLLLCFGNCSPQLHWHLALGGRLPRRRTRRTLCVFISAFETVSLVFNESVGVEGTPAAGARLKRHVVVIVEGGLIVSAHGAARHVYPTACCHFKEVGRGFWAGLAEVLRLRFLLDVPFLFACF